MSSSSRAPYTDEDKNEGFPIPSPFRRPLSEPLQEVIFVPSAPRVSIPPLAVVQIFENEEKMRENRMLFNRLERRIDHQESLTRSPRELRHKYYNTSDEPLRNLRFIGDVCYDLPASAKEDGLRYFARIIHPTTSTVPSEDRQFYNRQNTKIQDKISKMTPNEFRAWIVENQFEVNCQRFRDAGLNFIDVSACYYSLPGYERLNRQDGYYYQLLRDDCQRVLDLITYSKCSRSDKQAKYDIFFSVRPPVLSYIRQIKLIKTLINDEMSEAAWSFACHFGIEVFSVLANINPFKDENVFNQETNMGAGSNFELSERLLDLGFSPTELMTNAIKHNNARLFRLVYDKTNISLEDLRGTKFYQHNAPIFEVAEKGTLEMFDTIIAYGGNIFERNIAHFTPLSCAVFYHNWPVVRRLLEMGAIVDFPADEFKSTSLLLKMIEKTIPLDLLRVYLQTSPQDVTRHYEKVEINRYGIGNMWMRNDKSAGTIIELLDIGINIQIDATKRQYYQHCRDLIVEFQQ